MGPVWDEFGWGGVVCGMSSRREEYIGDAFRMKADVPMCCDQDANDASHQYEEGIVDHHTRLEIKYRGEGLN